MSGWVEDAGVQIALSTLLFRIPSGTGEIVNQSAENVASRARRDVPIGPGAGGHARSSVEARDGILVGGGAKYSYYPWLEFGGRVGINNSVNRQRIRSGRYIYPALVKERPLIEGRMERGLVSMARSSGLEAR